MNIPKPLLKKVNPKLRAYITSEVLSEYSKNDWGHQIGHIEYVIRRSLQFASTIPDINYDIVYAVAAFHDIGHYIDAAHHEKVSAQIFLKDQEMKKLFSDADRKTITEAIEDHRSNLGHPPRSVYGKIIASADCNISVDVMCRRTFTYRVRNFQETTLTDIIVESRQHLLQKYGKDGYARRKMYFDDPEFEAALRELQELLADESAFLKRYLSVNKLEQSYRLEQELSDFLCLVNPDLRSYIETKIFPQYAKNDRAHGILHIREVIRRAFSLNQSFKLNLDPDLIFAIASYHDLGKHVNSERHEFISAELFLQDAKMSKFFNQHDRQTIAEAIEDHRSSKSDSPRSTYGKLISSADRNTRVEMVFVRSFFVGKDRQPDTTVADFLDSNFQRLAKRYSEEDPENMFFADQEYRDFLIAMRQLLRDETAFKNKYCEINQISSRDHLLSEEPGAEISPVILI